jgi:hypothetical protein
MKRILSLAVLMAATMLVFAHGKVAFKNDSLHLVYFDSGTGFLFPADLALAGHAVPAGGLTPSGQTLVADLWAGTSAYSLVKVTTVGFSSLAAGTLSLANVTLPSNLPGGVPAYFQVQVYDAAAGSALQAWADGMQYFGLSQVFTAVPSSTTPYNSIVQSGSPAYSTWAPGAFNLDDVMSGATGAIVVGAYMSWPPPMSPEPSVLSLLGLGGAAMLLRRHRQLLKKALPLAVLMASTTLVCAQGKVQFRNDSLHLVYFITNPNILLPGDQALAGQAVPSGGVLPSGATLAADLWAGTSSSSLAKVSSTTFDTFATAGSWTPLNVVLPFPGGVSAYFQVQVYDQRGGSASGARADFLYVGLSPIFTAVPSSSTGYNSLVQTSAPAYSTWVPGTFSLDQVLSGAEGAIELRTFSPEPSVLALLGLGGAGLFALRRR